MFLVFKIILFQLVAINSPYYYQNTRSCQSMRYQAVLKSQIGLKITSSNWRWPKMIRKLDKSTFQQISAVLGSSYYLHCQRVLRTRPFMHLNKPVFQSQ